MSSSPRLPSSASPAPTSATTPGSCNSDTSSPHWNSNQFGEENPVDFSSYMENSPFINCVDPYLSANSGYNNTQSNTPTFNHDTYYQQGSVPSGSLLLSPAGTTPFGSGPQLSLHPNNYSYDGASNNNGNSLHRTSPIPQIRINTGLTSPSLNNVSTPNYSTSGLSASGYSPPSGYKSPYTPASSISPGHGTLVIASGGQSPAQALPQLQYPTSPAVLKSPYQMHQTHPQFTPSPTTSIGTFDNMNLVSHVGYPQPVHHPVHHPAPHAPLQPVQSVYDIAKMYADWNQLVPQKTYRPNTQSDRRRYVEEVQLEQPIMFFVTSPDGLGISCRDALNSRFIRLRDRDDQMFINRGPSVSIRVQWPGYPAWSRQIPTRDFRTPPGPITRAKLAKNVAKTVDRFITEMSTKPMEDEANPMWRVGHGHITVDSLELVGLQHVSMGSWQVHLRWRGHA